MWIFTVSYFESLWRHAITHYVFISLNNFWSPSKQIKDLNKWGKIFIFQIFFSLNRIMTITKITLDSLLYVRLLDEEHNFPICANRRRYPETNSCQDSSFFNRLFHWNLNKNEHFSPAFKTKMWTTKRCKVLIKTAKANFDG